MDAKDLIGQGIMAAKRGQNEKARELFNLALVTEPRSENAWLWLSTVAVDDAEKEDCLRQVIAINPANLNAANELQKLGEKRRGVLAAQLAALAVAQTAVDTPQIEAASTPVLAASAVAGARSTGKAASRRRGGRAQLPPVAKYAIIGGFGLLILIIVLGSFNLINRIINPIVPTITLTPSRTSTIPPTWTLTPTWTPTLCPLSRCTATPTNTPTVTPTFTETSTPSLTPSRTSTVTRTATNTSTPTNTSTATRTATATRTLTPSATSSASPSATTTTTRTPSITPTQ
jgi:hypothetical protein